MVSADVNGIGVLRELTVTVTKSTIIFLGAAAARSAHVSNSMLIERRVNKRFGFVFMVGL